MWIYTRTRIYFYPIYQCRIRTFKTICIRRSKISYSVVEENYTYIAQIILNYPNDEAANSRSGMLTFWPLHYLEV